MVCKALAHLFSLSSHNNLWSQAGHSCYHPYLQMRMPRFWKAEWAARGHTGLKRALEIRLYLCILLPNQWHIRMNLGESSLWILRFKRIQQFFFIWVVWARWTAILFFVRICICKWNRNNWLPLCQALPAFALCCSDTGYSSGARSASCLALNIRITLQVSVS